MNQHLKISVIVPSFNQGQYIEQTLQSVLVQPYKNFELIVVDGGSTDNTVAILKKYSAHLAFWVSEKDSGQSEAINKGLAKATGDIITWLNSDDYYEPNTLEKVANMFNNQPDTDAIHGFTSLFGNNTRPLVNGCDTELKPHQYLPYMRFPQPSSFFRAKVFKSCGGVNPQLHYAMDFELVVKAVLLGHRFVGVSDLLSHYRLHPASKSNHDMKFLKEWEGVVCNVFASVHGGEQWINTFRQLHIATHYLPVAYPCKINLTEQELAEVALEHLYLQYHYHYKILDKTFCHTLSTWLKTNHPDFYIKKQFNRYSRRLLIPAGLMRFGRKLMGRKTD